MKKVLFTINIFVGMVSADDTLQIKQQVMKFLPGTEILETIYIDKSALDWSVFYNAETIDSGHRLISAPYALNGAYDALVCDSDQQTCEKDYLSIFDYVFHEDDGQQISMYDFLTEKHMSIGRGYKLPNDGSGYAINVSLPGAGSYRVNFFSHAWFSSVKLNACLGSVCKSEFLKQSIDKFASNHVVIDVDTSGSQVLSLELIRSTRQYDYKETQWQAIEAIKLEEIKQ